MLRFKLAFAVCFALSVLFAGCDNAWSDGTVSGQLFVATRGGENYKLGDVEVVAYDYQAVHGIVETRIVEAKDLYKSLVSLQETTEGAVKQADAAMKAASDAAFDRHDYSDSDPQLRTARELDSKIRKLNLDAQWAVIYSHSALYYLEKLLDPITTTRSHADGRFSISLHHGKFALAARANRRIGDIEETYSWLVAVDVGDKPISINLANANMTSGDTSASLIHTINSEDESLAAAGKEGLADLLRFKEEQNAKIAAQKQMDEAILAEKRSAYIRANLPQLVKASQARALATHPDLGKAGTDLNKKFIADYGSV